MPNDSFVLYIGLRRNPLEWRAEIEAAVSLGYDVHVVSDTSLEHTGLGTDRTGRFMFGETADATAEAIIHELPDKPAAVVCWGDRYPSVTASVASLLGLRGTGTAGAAICADKVAQRRALEPYGLNPRWRAGHDLDDLRACAREFGRGIFKLAHSSGGRGTALLRSDSDLTALLAATDLNYLPSTAFLVEEFVDGSEHSVTGVVCDGQVTVFGISDKIVGDDLVTHTTIFPTRLPDDRATAVAAAAATAVNAVGLLTGGFHVDLRLTGQGPVVLEVGARLGGDLINSHLVPLATGDRVHPYRALIELLVTGRAPEPMAPRVAAAMTIVSGGTRHGDDLAGHLATHPRVVTAASWPQPGARDAAAVVTAATPAEAATAAEQVRAW